MFEHTVLPLVGSQDITGSHPPVAAMDGLSAVASGFAAVSLAVQLGENIKRFCSFWEEVRNAPEIMMDTVTQLRLLQPILDEIYRKEQRDGPNQIIVPILSSISGKIDQLTNLVEYYRPGLSSSSHRARTWNSFKFSIKGSQVEKLRASLMEAKMTLVMACSNLSESVYYSASLAPPLTLSKSQIQIEQHETTRTAVRTGFANVNIQASSERIATTIQTISDINDHVHAIRKDLLQVVQAFGVPDTGIASGMQSAIDKASQDLVNRLTAAVRPRSQPYKSHKRTWRACNMSDQGMLPPLQITTLRRD